MHIMHSIRRILVLILVAGVVLTAGTEAASAVTSVSIQSASAVSSAAATTPTSPATMALAGIGLGFAPAASLTDPWGNSYPELCGTSGFSESDFWSNTTYDFKGTYQQWVGANLITYHKWHAERYYWFNNQTVSGDFSEGCSA